MDKTNAMRLLDQRKVPYTAVVYDASGEFHSADEAARLLGVPPETVFKTLVIVRDAPGGKPMLLMLPAHREADLRMFAQQVGEKKVRMATQREAEQMTGLQVGGISALALLNRGLTVYIEESARALERIHISAGMRGVDIFVPVKSLVESTRARFVRATTTGAAEGPAT